MKADPSEIDRKTFGGNVRIKRGLQNLGVADLAHLAGVSRETVYKVERGEKVRVGTLQKITAALQEDFRHARTQEIFVWDKGERPYVRHDPEDSVWYAIEDGRRTVPEDNHALVQNPEERARLGRLGLVSVFASVPHGIMPNGPGTIYIEVFSRYEGTWNKAIYKDAKLVCLRGEVVLTLAGDEIPMRPGSEVGFETKMDVILEPRRRLAPGEAPPIMLWVGANRVGDLGPFA